MIKPYRARIRNWKTDWFRPGRWPRRETRAVLLTLAIIVGIATTIAAVPGIFSSVNSTQGYQVNGAAGSGGQALCSDGTYFNTPCSTGVGTITGVAAASPLVGGGTSGIVSVGLSSSLFVPRTCNSNGCYEVINGTIHEWGHSATIADGAPGTNVCFPYAFTVSVDSANVSDDLAVGATSTPSVAGLSPSSGATPYPCANGGLWVWGTRAGNAVYWSAWGK